MPYVGFLRNSSYANTRAKAVSTSVDFYWTLKMYNPDITSSSAFVFPKNGSMFNQSLKFLAQKTLKPTRCLSWPVQRILVKDKVMV